MNTQLFFDDERLFVRENVKRTLGKAELIADSVYKDGISTTAWCSGSVLKKDGKYLLLYFAHVNDNSNHLFIAESTDGVHFSPMSVDAGLENPIARHEIMPLPKGAEIADLYEDKSAPDDERYKILMAEFDSKNLMVNDTLYVSSDLINWRKKDDAFWGNGAEPLTNVFYNQKRKCYTILLRPFWGIRKVGFSETTDWKSFTPFAPCMQQDSLDEPLSEIYGMKALPYGNMFIGFPHMYCKHKNCYSAKYDGGNMELQLAYSYDGRYWQRSLREPFITGENIEDIKALGYENKMIWMSDSLINDDGSINIYTETSTKEHGSAFHYGDHAAIQVYRVRKDGFICLENENPEKPSLVATREKIWNGGEVHINICAKFATVAVYAASETKDVGGNMLGIAHQVDGYSHDDCVPFSGDSTDWVPVFKSGKTVSELSGKTIVIEVKFENGKLYSISGDYIDVYNTEAGRYRIFGTIPENK